MCGESSELRRQKDAKPRINEPGERNEMFKFVLGVAAALDVNYQQRIVRGRLTGILVPGRRKIDEAWRERHPDCPASATQLGSEAAMDSAWLGWLGQRQAPCGVSVCRDSPSQNLVQATTLQIGVFTRTSIKKFEDILRNSWALAWWSTVKSGFRVRCPRCYLPGQIRKSMGHPRVHAEWYRTPYPTPTGVRGSNGPGTVTNPLPFFQATELRLSWISLSPVLSLRPNGLSFDSGRPETLFFMIFKIFFNVTNFLGNHFYRYRDEGNATGGPLP
ncbi:hypothetical protein B0H14DRAFT_3598772 [Mycena olivaceomarginata]|nr:hypothetical protein B0H14DRAFT_3598772 [Mycena olivaceomarginata]